MLDDGQVKPGWRWMRCTVSGILCCGALLVPAGALGQSVSPPLPPTREEITRPVTPTLTPQSRLQVEGGIERAPCALDGSEYRSIHFVLRGAEFEGLQGLTRADLSSAFAPMIGRDVPISAVC